MKQFYRILSVLLIIAMMVSLLPIQSVLALTDENVEALSTPGTLTLSLRDSEGDGWDGNELALYVNEVYVRTYFASGRSATYTLEFDPTSFYEFKWIEGQYADECSFTIALDGTTIFYASSSACDSYTNNQVVFTYGQKAQKVVEGTCGTKLTWAIYDNGVLKISGTGTMSGYAGSSPYTAPWQKHTSKFSRVIIENGVTSIGSNAFYLCDTIERISIPDSVTTIGQSAFRECTSLKQIEIPDSVTKMENAGFYGCTQLKTVKLPSGISILNTYMFYGCTSLESIEIPANITKLGTDVFNGCTNLRSVVFAGNVTSIGNYTFKSCSNLNEVIFIGTAPSFGNYTFSGTTTTVYYNSAKSGWTSSVLQNYGGTVTWRSSPAASGSGTQSSPYLISSEADLRRVALYVRNGLTTQGMYFRLDRNITLTESWSSIGTEANPFRGTFDGNNYKISNMTVRGDYIGLFGYIGSGATIKNLNLTDVDAAGATYVAGLAAYADAGTGSITISNCSVSGSVKDDLNGNLYDGYLGGILAYANAKDGSITITDCTTTGSYVCDSYSGGIIGYGIGTNRSLKLVNCINDAYIAAGSNSTHCGGIGGTLTSAELRSCINHGSVSGNAYSEDNGSSWLGGIIGEGSGCVFNGCANYGDVSTFFAGGITGSQYGNHIANTCLNIGELSYSSDGYGAAIIYSGTAINSYFLTGTGPARNGSIGATASEMSSGAVAHAMREYFGQEIGVDNYPVPLTANNRVYKVTVTGEVNGSFYTNYGGTVALPELSSCAAYFDGNTKFDVTTPITRDYALAAKGYHKFVNGVCTYCGSEGVNYIDVGNCGDSVAWSLSESGVLTISGSGEMANYSAANPAPWKDYASQIKSVIISEGVSSIGAYAFAGLTNVTSVSVADSVSTIGSYSFQGLANLTQMTFGNRVTDIGEYAFASCTGLATVTFGKQVKTIGAYAFSQCTSLNYVSIPANVTTLGDGAFRGCTGISSLYMENGLTSIGAYALAETGVTNLTIPATVTTIGDYAFANNAGLYQVTFNGAAPSIGANAFRADTVNCHVPNYDSSWASNVTKQFGGSLTWAIDSGSCGNNGDNVKYVLDFTGTLTISGTGAMYNYYSGNAPWSSVREQIKSVVIREGVTSIGDYAFDGCSKMTSVTIADSVTKIGSSTSSYYYYGRCFRDCASLTQITIPKNVTLIANGCFYGCTSLTAINVDSGNTSFTSENGVLYSRYKSELYCYPAGKTGSVTIPSSVSAIMPFAFYGCNSFAQITMPSGVTSIGSYAFGECKTLNQITFAGSAPTIASEAFSHVTADVYYPVDNSSWTASVMEDYYGDLTWKSGSGTCGANAQWDLSYKNGSGTLTISGTGAMYDYTADTVPWKHYRASIKTFVVNDGVTSVGAYALSEATSLTTARIANSVTSIGESAFYNCTSLSNLTLSNGLKTIGDDAFFSTRISSITFPETLQSIGAQAFYSSSLTAVTLPNSLTSIGNHAFASCKSLKTVTCGNGLKTIGNYAFSSDTALQTVDLGSSVTTLGIRAFSGCNKLTKIVIPASVTSIDNYAFADCTGLLYAEFLGNGPTFGTTVFSGVTCNAYYLSSKSSWTSSKLANHGGTLTWGAISQRGTCNSAIDWILDNAGNLYICGSGAMPAYSESTKAPWYDYRSSIKTVTLRGVTSVSAYAFSGCNALTMMTIPSTVNTIGNYAFADCTSLQVVIFEGSAPTFGANAFSGTTSEMWYQSSWSTSVRKDYGGTLTWRKVSAIGTCGTNTKWALDTAGTLVVLGTGAMSSYSSTSQPWYSNRSSIKSVVIGDKITSIGNYAFYSNTALQSVTIGESVTSIGSYAFSSDSALKTIIFKGNAPSITYNSFNQVTATAQYPLANTTWTSSKRQNYGGTITWEAVCTNHKETVAAAVAPTCTTTGLTEGKYCSLCNEVLLAQEGIPALGHYTIGPNGTEVPADTITPSCTVEYICTVCNKVALAAMGHRVTGTTLVETDPLTITLSKFTLTNGTYYSTNTTDSSTGSLMITAKYDCTLTLHYGVSSEEDWDKLYIYKNGSTKDKISGEVSDQSMTLNLTAGDTVEVRYKKDDSQKSGSDKGWVTLVYDLVMAPAIGDVPAETAEPGCVEGVVCKYCQFVVKEALGHRVILRQPEPENPISIINTSASPFVLEDGTYYSSNHGVSSSADLQIKVNSGGTVTLNYGVSSEQNSDKLIILVNGAAKDTISGLVSNQSMTLAVTAGDVIVVRYSKDSSINMYEDQGWVSLQYEAETVEEIVPAETVEADCDGVTCDYCQTVVKEALGHNWDAGVVSIPATETTEGEMRYTCERCGETKTQSIPVLEHTHRHEAIVTPPTCEAQGFTTHSCTCGDEYVDTYVDALGHTEVVDTAVAATCTTTGLTEGKHCSVCNEVLAEQTVVDALGHTEAVDAAVAATCTTTGLTEGKHCSVCNEVLVEQTVVDALGHTEVVDTAVAATCTATGLTEGKHCSVCGEVLVAQTVVDALGHTEVVDTAVAATCIATGLTEGKHCSVCGEVLVAQTVIPAKGHADDNEDFTCDTCGEDLCTDHVEKEIPGKAATCTATGLTVGKKCAICGDVLVAQTTIPAKGHTEVVVSGKAATCTETGLTDGTKCSVCGEILQAQEVIPATDHTEVVDAAVAATCTATGLTEGKHCSVCGEILVAQTVVDALGHTEAVDAAVAATCTATGLTEGKHCSVCGEILVAQTVVDALGHTEAVDAAVAATCTTTGLTEGKHCSVCDEVLVAQTVVNALGHTDDNEDFACDTCGDNLCTDHVEEEIPGKPASCTASGLTVGKKCAACGEILVAQTTIPAKGHTEVAVSGKAATCTATGLTNGTKCSVCDETIKAQEVIPATGHNMQQTSAKVEASCETAGKEAVQSCANGCGKTEGGAVIPATGHTDKSIAGKAATCTVTGLTEGKVCSVCGETTKQQEIIPALGHTEVVDAAVAATCTATGLTEGKRCSVCAEVLVARTVVDALGHTEVVNAAVAATCTATGLTEGKECTTCGVTTVAQTVIPAKGHADSNEDFTCDACGENLCTDHEEEAIPEKAASCTATGLTAGKKCAICGEVLVAQTILPATGHTEVAVSEKAATCTETGLTAGTKCSTCGEILQAQEVIPAIGHNMQQTSEKVEASCEAAGREAVQTCANGCGKTEGGAGIPATGHTDKPIAGKAATCTETGLTEGKECSVCGETIKKQEIIPALGHSYAYTMTTKPTETAAGNLTGRCSVCDATEVVTLPKLNETDYTYQVIEEPTEEATGLGRYTWKNTAYGEFAVDVVLDRTSATLPGDMSGDGVVTDKDVIALLWHVLFPDGNPIHGEGDINGDGVVTDKDVIALLWHVLFPNAYPL